MNKDLVTLVVDTMRELDDQQNIKLPQELGSETPLFGEDGIVDSIALVTVVVAVEQAIEDELGVGVSLADAKAMSQKSSPFSTVGALADYAGKAIAEQQRSG